MPSGFLSQESENNTFCDVHTLRCLSVLLMASSVSVVCLPSSSQMLFPATYGLAALLMNVYSYFWIQLPLQLIYLFTYLLTYLFILSLAQL